MILHVPAAKALAQALRDAAGIIDAAMPKTTQPVWVSVKDGMPMEQCDYLCKLDSGRIAIKRPTSSLKFVSNNETVTHWMKIPSAPE